MMLRPLGGIAERFGWEGPQRSIAWDHRKEKKQTGKRKRYIMTQRKGNKGQDQIKKKSKRFHNQTGGGQLDVPGTDENAERDSVFPNYPPS